MLQRETKERIIIATPLEYKVKRKLKNNQLTVLTMLC